VEGLPPIAPSGPRKFFFNGEYVKVKLVDLKKKEVFEELLLF
jgi:hypothetical protein